MAELKIRKSKVLTVEQEAGVTISIKGIDSEDMRNEIARALSKKVPPIVEKILGEQLTLEEPIGSASESD